jgi:DNA-directed RNA polymerase subunit RPC12/RpoP
MTAIITCPECDKKFKGREDARGKKMRCPACSTVFVVEEVKIDEGARAPTAKAAATKAAAPPPMPAPPPPPKPFDDDEEEGSNPYGVGHLDLSPRCPNCANEMESQDAIICLYCGYNTQTRTLGQTKKVIGHTHVDRLGWLMPGIACAAGIFVLAMLDVTFVFGLPAVTHGSAFWSWFTNEPSKLWVTLIMLAAMWAMGRFAYKRLLLEPTPPEEELD